MKWKLGRIRYRVNSAERGSARGSDGKGEVESGGKKDEKHDGSTLERYNSLKINGKILLKSIEIINLHTKSNK